MYRGALEALGGLKDPQGIPALTAALGRGEWWAPGRTRDLRNLAAMALSKIGTPEAVAALEDVASNGPRGARTRGQRSPRRRTGRRQAPGSGQGLTT